MEDLHDASRMMQRKLTLESDAKPGPGHNGRVDIRELTRRIQCFFDARTNDLQVGSDVEHCVTETL